MELIDMELVDMELVDMELVDMELVDMELVDEECVGLCSLALLKGALVYGRAGLWTRWFMDAFGCWDMRRMAVKTQRTCVLTKTQDTQAEGLQVLRMERCIMKTRIASNALWDEVPRKRPRVSGVLQPEGLRAFHALASRWLARAWLLNDSSAFRRNAQTL